MPTVEPKIVADDEKLSVIERGLKPGLIEEEQPGMLLKDRMAHHGVTDVSIAIIDGDKIIPKAYHLTTSSESAATTETLFQAGSISKFVNAIIALKLVEEGKLILDEDVNNRLEGWKVPENEHTTSEKITLRRLLSHTAGLNLHGFPGYSSTTDELHTPTNEAILNGGFYLMKSDTLPSTEEIASQELANHYIFVDDESRLFYIDMDDKPHEVQSDHLDNFKTSITEFLHEAADKKIIFTSEQMQNLIRDGECTPPAPGTAYTSSIKPIMTPGTEFRYSGGGTQIVQQLIIEAMGGEKSYVEIAKEVVFEPLGMTFSTFELKRQAAPSSTYLAASGHLSDGSIVPGGSNLYPESAAAGLWTTPTDLAKFVIGIQNHSILSEKTTALMFAQQPNSPCGLGPFLNPEAHEFSHGGGTVGFIASCTGFTHMGKGAIIMTNSNNGGELCQELNRSIASAYEWPKEFSDHPIKVTKPDSGILSPLVGDYDLPTSDGSVKLTISRQDDSRFFIALPFPTSTSPSVEFELKQQSNTNFYFPIGPGNTARITLVDGHKDQFELFGSIATKKQASVDNSIEIINKFKDSINQFKDSDTAPASSSDNNTSMNP